MITRLLLYNDQLLFTSRVLERGHEENRINSGGERQE